jgi:hypothetical protein
MTFKYEKCAFFPMVVKGDFCNVYLSLSAFAGVWQDRPSLQEGGR